MIVASRLKLHERVTVRLTRTEPHLQGELVDASRLPIYWSFRVTNTDSTLGGLIRKERRDLTISTSRSGRTIREAMQDVSVRWRSSQRPMVLFGSPDSQEWRLRCWGGVRLQPQHDSRPRSRNRSDRRGANSDTVGAESLGGELDGTQEV